MCAEVQLLLPEPPQTPLWVITDQDKRMTTWTFWNKVYNITSLLQNLGESSPGTSQDPKKEVAKIYSSLPEEMLRMIFSFLPPKDLKAAILICKLLSIALELAQPLTRACKPKRPISGPLEEERRRSFLASPQEVKNWVQQLPICPPFSQMCCCFWEI